MNNRGQVFVEILTLILAFSLTLGAIFKIIDTQEKQNQLSRFSKTSEKTKNLKKMKGY